MQNNRMTFIKEKKAKDVFNTVTCNEMREMTFERFKSALHWYMSGEDFMDLYNKSISHKKLNWFQKQRIEFRYIYYFLTGLILGFLISYLF